MASIIIRNLDDFVAIRLRTRARERGTSVEEEARRILTEATRLSRDEFFEWAAKFRARQRPNKTRAVDLIREDRDR